MAYDWFTLFKSCHLDSKEALRKCGEFLLSEIIANTHVIGITADNPSTLYQTA